MIFKDRYAAGKALAEKLIDHADADSVVVLALPRGGVPVGFEVAQKLNAPLDVFVVRKLGVPGQSELAMGAIASGNTEVYNEDIIKSIGLSGSVINAVLRKERIELKRREEIYRDNEPPISVRDKTVIVVDDGLATGATMKAAVQALRKLFPKKIIVAVPVAARQAVDDLAFGVDQVVYVMVPEPFWGVGSWYENFNQTDDDEVRECLHKSRHPAVA